MGEETTYVIRSVHSGPPAQGDFESSTSSILPPLSPNEQVTRMEPPEGVNLKALLNTAEITWWAFAVAKCHMR